MEGRCIPQRRYRALSTLADRLAKKRVQYNTIVGKMPILSKSNHAAYLLDDRGGHKVMPLVYGENHSRGRPHVAIHAESDTLRRAGRISRVKSYSLLVIKVSNRGIAFGMSNCCLRCQCMLVNSPIKISRVYFSTPTGIQVGKPGEMAPHVCELDRKIEGRAHHLAHELGLECNEEEDEEAHLNGLF